jgi:hypothetical protein
VFRAFDPENDRLVAVKLFRVDLPPERLHQLVDELEWLLAADLTHPAVAAALATGICGNHAYLAQEYVAADSLDVAVREYGPAPPADVLRVAAQLAGALDFAAVVEIGHGALHPRDVLLSPEDTRLTGLGIARAFERVGVAPPVRRPYTPPERVAGEWNRRSDIFSLAALMHEMLWGRRMSPTGPETVESLTALAGGHLDALRALFARALAENPADRFETALEFAQALTQAFPDVTMGSPQPPVYRAQPPDLVIGAHERVGDGTPRLPLDEPPLDLDLAPAVVEGRGLAASPALTIAAPAAISGALSLRPPARAHQDVELAAAISGPSDPVEAHAAIRAPGALINGHPADAPISVLERSRSAVWPLVLALSVGAAIGFAGGYDVGTQRSAPAPAASAQPAPPAGREWTEGAVNESGRTPPAAAGASAPTQDPAATLQAGAQVATQQPAPRAASSEGAGRLLVHSTPAGARVFVDGRDQGKTPLAVQDLSSGAHRVRVVRDGYAPEERRISITVSRPAQSMTVALSPVRGTESRPLTAASGTVGRFFGALAVESRPPGATVFVDGKLVGTTPMHLPSVSAGEHAVRLEREGYRRWSSSVRVVATEQNRVTASLEK